MDDKSGIWSLCACVIMLGGDGLFAGCMSPMDIGQGVGLGVVGLDDDMLGGGDFAVAVVPLLLISLLLFCRQSLTIWPILLHDVRLLDVLFVQFDQLCSVNPQL